MISLEKHVVNIELSKRLKELGVKQESLYLWSDHTKPPTLWHEASLEPQHGYEVYFAFTVAELGEMLPGGIDTARGTSDYMCRFALFLQYNKVPDEKKRFTRGSFHADTEADARANVLMYLVENGLLQKSARTADKRGG